MDIKKALKILEKNGSPGDLLEVLKSSRRLSEILLEIRLNYAKSWMGIATVEFIIKEEIIPSPTTIYEFLEGVLWKLHTNYPSLVKEGVEFALKNQMFFLAKELFRFLCCYEHYELTARYAFLLMGKYPFNQSFKKILREREWKLIAKYHDFLPLDFLEKIFYEEKEPYILENIARAIFKKGGKVERLFERYLRYATFEDLIEEIKKNRVPPWLELSIKALTNFKEWEGKVIRVLKRIKYEKYQKELFEKILEGLPAENFKRSLLETIAVDLPHLIDEKKKEELKGTLKAKAKRFLME